MGFLSQLANVFTGSEDAKAATRAGEIQQAEAQRQGANIGVAGQSAISRFDPLAAVGQQGIEQAGFLGSPQEQFQFIQNNPLFQLGLDNLNEQTLKGAAARGRLSSGDTLQQLTQNATLASQPLIDRQRQDILNLLGISQNVTGQQAGIERQTAQDVANLLTGGAAAQAAGVVGAQNARQGAMGNIFDLGTTIAGMPSGTFSNPFASPLATGTTTGGSFANFPPQ